MHYESLISNLNINNRMQPISSRQLLDYFKLFKIFDLKKLQKHGDVKLTHDKLIARKVLTIDGHVSTQNYLVLDTATLSLTSPGLSFSQRYLYIVGYLENGKNFCFQLTLHLNAKVYKVLYSTVHKIPKMTSQGLLQMPLEMVSCKWTTMVIDLFELCEKYSQMNEIRMSFKLAALEIRANSRVKNIYQSEILFDPHSFPKDMELPKKPNEDYYSKYNYFVCGQKTETKQQKTEAKQEKPQPIKQKQKIQVETKSEVKEDSKTVAGQNPERKASMEKKKVESKKVIKPTRVSGIKHQGVKPTKDTDPEPQFSFEEEVEEAPRRNMAPTPKVTISANLMALQGSTLSCNGISALGAFITSPVLFAVHKQIACMSVHENNPLKLAVGYSDGSICLWDTLRHKSIYYLKTELKQIRLIQASGEGEQEKMFLVGSDKMKREVILILNSQDVLFKQVSNYSITNFTLAANPKGQEMIVSYGFENIRLWKLNHHNSIITGVGLYLGKLNRKVNYNSACLVGEGRQLLVADSSGYLSRVCLENERMEEMRKISENGFDHIVHLREWNQLIVAQSSGRLKVLNYQLQLLEEYELGSRIRTLSYQVQGGHMLLNLNNYNHTLSQFNMSISDYRFLSRQHGDKVLGLAFMSKLSKVVSISKDNTIRIWSLQVSESQSPTTPWQIKQEYEFLINSGETMTSLCADNSSHAYIGFTGGLVRKIDVNNFQILKQESMAFAGSNEEETIPDTTVIRTMDVSKNGKSILICCQSLTSDKSFPTSQPTKKAYVILADCELNILFKFDCPSHNSNTICQVLAVFNDSLKKVAICWSYGAINRLQTFSLANPSEVKSEFYLNWAPKSLKYSGKIVESHAKGDNGQDVLEMYDEETGQIKQMIGMKKEWEGQCTICYPLCFSCSRNQQLQISALEVGVHSSRIKESVDMPQKVSNFALAATSDMKMVLCSGDLSNAIYAVGFQVHNIEQLLQHNIKYSQEEEQQQEQVSFRQEPLPSNLNELRSVKTSLCASQDPSSYGPKLVMGPIVEDDDQDEQIIDLAGKQIKSIYSQELKIFEQVKHALFPQDLQQEHYEGQTMKEYNASEYEPRETHKGVELMYGWETKYSNDPNLQPQKLIWEPKQQTAIFVSGRTLIKHEFKLPIAQTFVRLPATPSLVVQLGRYIGVAMGNQLRLYSFDLGYIRSMTALGVEIRSASISECEGFAVVLSSDRQHTYIQILDMLTSSAVCNSYLPQVLPGSVRIEVNPFQKCLEFLVVWPECFRFYRMTSIMTLQTQEDEEVAHILNNSDAGDIRSVCYIKLGEEELILFGTRDGSLVIVDSRTASVLILSRKVVNYPIVEIMHHNQEDGESLLVLVGESNSITTYQLQCSSVKELIRVLGEPASATLTTDSQISSYSSVHHLSHGAAGMLIMSKCGVLWLMDLSGKDTIKILSVHVPLQSSPQNRITQALQLSEGQIISGGVDGTVKCTSLFNLQQNYQIYKPRKTVKDIIIVPENGLMVVGFECELFFYAAQPGAREPWRYLGLVGVCAKNTSEQLVGVRNIPYTDNYIVCTNCRIIVLYHHKAATSLKVEMQEICGQLHNAQAIDLLGYNHILVKSRAKIDVWVRKQRRGERVVEELSKVQELKYYMMDAYQAASIGCFFVNQHIDKGGVEKEYIVCLADRPLIQWRDFHEHAILREVEIGVSNPSCFQMTQECEFLVGDQEGVVWWIRDNGLTLEKLKALDGRVEGVKQMKNGKVVAFGRQLAILSL